VRVEVSDVVAYCAQLNARGYQNARPGYQLQPWGTTDMTVADPSGNRITFFTVNT